MKAVILLSLKIHLVSPLLDSFRVSYIDDQRRLKSLLLLCWWGGRVEGHIRFKLFIENRPVSIRPQVCVEEAGLAAVVSLRGRAEAVQLSGRVWFTVAEMGVPAAALL